MIPLKKPIDFKEVKRLTGLSRSTIYAYENAGKFPKRTAFTKRTVRWEESEVIQWIAERGTHPAVSDDTIHKVRAKKAAKHEQRAL
ncbi:TPA: AlpA family phage regulatory protein [Morganella morganii]|nr:AlpA family phage regulatory protein [Morganella morganii]